MRKMEIKSFLRYSALVLGLILGVILSLFSLDSFPQHGTWKEIEGFLIGLAPSLVVILTSVFAFIRPKYGFIVFLIITIAFTFFFHTYRSIQNFMIISFTPLVITLFLFAASRESKRNST
jgi:hypothetical protein